MSNKETVSVQELAIYMTQLEEYIKRLQERITSLTAEVEEVRLSRRTLEELRSLKPESKALIALDRRGHVFATCILMNPQQVITHIGVDYYAELPLDKAVSILLNKERDLTLSLQSLEAELRKAAKVYEEMQNKLAKIIAASQQRQQIQK